MCFTDPPYNVALGDHGGQGRGQRRRRIANDAIDPVAWEAFVRGWAADHPRLGRRRPLHLHEQQGAAARRRASSPRKAATGATRSSGSRTASSSDAPTTSAPTSPSGMAGARAPSTSGRVAATRTTSGASTGPSESPLHPTMKPLPLIERAISNSSEPGALVLDPFMGSGLDAHRLRAHRTHQRRHRARPPLLRRHRRALGGVHRPEGGEDRWLTDPHVAVAMVWGTAPAATMKSRRARSPIGPHSSASRVRLPT